MREKNHMARVRLAKKTGFCFGVRRAVAMAEGALKRSKGNISSFGSIIHNAQVVKELSKKGLKVVKDIKRVKPGGSLVISSHGLSPRIYEDIAKRGIEIIDATCPFVLNAQKIAKRLKRKGCRVVIVGEASHPEVRALVDFAPGAAVIKDKLEAKSLGIKRSEDIGVISQTTQSPANFSDVVRVMARAKPKSLTVVNTICNDAEERQNLAKELAKEVDLMLVVGGRDSANTRRLFEVCRKILKDTHLVETDKDVKGRWLKAKDVVGITSGASTPDWVIKKIVDKLKSNERGCVTNG